MRGYFGIGIEHGKTEANLGMIWRSAHNFGADFIFTIGSRYHKTPTLRHHQGVEDHTSRSGRLYRRRFVVTP